MWKPDQLDAPTPSSVPQAPNTSQPSEPATRVLLSTGESATIGKGLVIRGEITGTDSLLIEGRVEGNIHLDGNRVTVGRNGEAIANITAQEVVVLGKVRGNITATDRLEVRVEGAVVGDLSAPRISIEDGAFFKGAIEIRKPSAKEANRAGVSSTAMRPPAKAQ